MPSNAVAVVMDDEGHAKLACKARNAEFSVGDANVERGVVSYYAARTIADAGTVQEWVARMNEAIRRDREAEKLGAGLWVQMRVTGNATLQLPGERARQ